QTGEHGAPPIPNQGRGPHPPLAPARRQVQVPPRRFRPNRSRLDALIHRVYAPTMRLMSRARFSSALIMAALTTLAHTAASQTKDQREIRALVDEWQRDIAADNVDAIVALHAPDAVVMFSNAPVAKGSTAIRAVYSEMVKTPGLLLHWIPTRIDVTSPTTANEYGTYTESYDSPGGKMRDIGNYVVIWRKIGGRWRVSPDAPNSTPSLPGHVP